MLSGYNTNIYIYIYDLNLAWPNYVYSSVKARIPKFMQTQSSSSYFCPSIIKTSGFPSTGFFRSSSSEIGFLRSSSSGQDFFTSSLPLTTGYELRIEISRLKLDYIANKDECIKTDCEKPVLTFKYIGQPPGGNSKHWNMEWFTVSKLHFNNLLPLAPIKNKNQF